MGKSEFLNGPAADQMFMDDAFQNYLCARMIPNAFRIDDRNRSADTNPETICFGAIDERFGADQIQFIQPAFQKFPGSKAFITRTAFWVSRIGAEKYVTTVFFHPQSFGHAAQLVFHIKKS